jgi:hypothetical protein
MAVPTDAEKNLGGGDRLTTSSSFFTVHPNETMGLLRPTTEETAETEVGTRDRTKTEAEIEAESRTR